MRYCEASQGRVFISSLDDGDMMLDVIEKCAEEKRVQQGCCALIGEPCRKNDPEIGFPKLFV